MTDQQYIKYLQSHNMALVAENQKLKAKIENHEHTINLLNQLLFSLRSRIDQLKEKYSK